MKDLNVYQMYYANNKKYGFFIKRNSWGNTKMKVTKIQGVIEGQEINGKAPYYDNPIVESEVYINGEHKGSDVVSCAGTFSYKMSNKII